MSTDSNLSDPYKAREHARKQGGTVVEAMPILPVSKATHLPADINKSDLIWDETIAGGEYCARILSRGSRLRMINLKGDGCVNLMVFNADMPIERLNQADTVKVQWNAYLNEGKLLLSDMGRVLMSITKDTCGKHDTICGASSAKSNAKKYGVGDNYSPYPNARDRFLLAIAKYGLAKKDIHANINFFKGVKVENGGGLTFIQDSSKAGDIVELRAEMNVLVVLANTPHVLDERKQYTCTPIRLLGYRGAVTPVDDPIRNACPENIRAFENVDDYFLK